MSAPESVYARRRRRTEEMCLAKLRENRFTTIFWITETYTRAKAMERLVESGRIIRLNQEKHGFPLMEFEVKETP